MHNDKSVNVNDLFLRNKGYVSEKLQEKIRQTRILIAGCGIGSTIAEAAVRLGFENITLADRDTVDIHNLNRQAYDFADVGSYKVCALSKRLSNINPNLFVKEFNEWINKDNVEALVKDCDLVFDTVDFLDLSAITVLHDQANLQGKPVISAVSAGWGATAFYCPPNNTTTCSFRTLFGLPETGSVENASYVKHFAVFFERVSGKLDESIVKAMQKALTCMEDGTPCPAPHVSAGSFAVASLAVTMAARILNGEKITTAPRMVIADMLAVCKSEGIDLSPML